MIGSAISRSSWLISWRRRRGRGPPQVGSSRWRRRRRCDVQAVWFRHSPLSPANAPPRAAALRQVLATLDPPRGAGRTGTGLSTDGKRTEDARSAFSRLAPTTVVLDGLMGSVSGHSTSCASGEHRPRGEVTGGYDCLYGSSLVSSNVGFPSSISGSMNVWTAEGARDECPGDCDAKSSLD